MSDIEREAFEQIYSIPTGAEWCEKRHIYIHKNYSGLVLHPINESWEAFCEGALWQASRRALSSCWEIPNSSGHASRQALEGERAMNAELTEEIGHLEDLIIKLGQMLREIVNITKGPPEENSWHSTHDAVESVERLQARVAAQQSALNSICTCSWGGGGVF